jgi:hypothetical protein
MQQQQELQDQLEIDRLNREIQIVQQRVVMRQENRTMMINSMSTPSSMAIFDTDVTTGFSPYRNELIGYSESDVITLRRNLLSQGIRSTTYQQQHWYPNQAPLQWSSPAFATQATSTHQLANESNSYLMNGVVGLNANTIIPYATPPLPLSLPRLLVQPSEDQCRLSEFQYLLRQQIEVFEANVDDATTHKRGRNKPVTFGQVGIRCKHCAHLPVEQRQNGAVYFPSKMLGLYQAAQNMASTHIQDGSCECMPGGVKFLFLLIMNKRQGAVNNGAGRTYWSKSASLMGLVDTESHGIRLKWNLPPDATVLDESV